MSISEQQRINALVSCLTEHASIAVELPVFIDGGEVTQNVQTWIITRVQTGFLYQIANKDENGYEVTTPVFVPLPTATSR
jgi:hypothetical protein